MATIALTGSASGIGAATRAVLEMRGDQVVGIDLQGAEIEADLASAEGREAACAQTLEHCGGVLDGVVACAGVGGIVHPGSRVMSVNYFGAVATLAGLRGALEKGDLKSAVAISSNSTVLMPKLPPELIDSCLEGDEERARSLGEEHAWAAYGASKTALARWVRRNAVGADWAGKGIRLNAIAPGRILTPLDDEQLANEKLKTAVENLPIPIGRPGQADEIAEFVAFLLSAKGSFFCGSVLFQDGGTDALVRADDWPVGITGAFPEVLIPK